MTTLIELSTFRGILMPGMCMHVFINWCHTFVQRLTEYARVRVVLVRKQH